jgi:hypothetical protein
LAAAEEEKDRMLHNGKCAGRITVPKKNSTSSTCYEMLSQAIPKAFEYPTQIKKFVFCLLFPSHIILTPSFFKSKDTTKVCVKIKKETKQQ